MITQNTKLPNLETPIAQGVGARGGGGVEVGGLGWGEVWGWRMQEVVGYGVRAKGRGVNRLIAVY